MNLVNAPCPCDGECLVAGGECPINPLRVWTCPVCCTGYGSLEDPCCLMEVEDEQRLSSY